MTCSLPSRTNTKVSRNEEHHPAFPMDDVTLKNWSRRWKPKFAKLNPTVTLSTLELIGGVKIAVGMKSSMPVPVRGKLANMAAALKNQESSNAT